MRAASLAVLLAVAMLLPRARAAELQARCGKAPLPCADLQRQLDAAAPGDTVTVTPDFTGGGAIGCMRPHGYRVRGSVTVQGAPQDGESVLWMDCRGASRAFLLNGTVPRENVRPIDERMRGEIGNGGAVLFPGVAWLQVDNVTRTSTNVTLRRLGMRNGRASSGGCVLAEHGDVHIDGCQFERCQATNGSGGAVLVQHFLPNVTALGLGGQPLPAARESLPVMRTAVVQMAVSIVNSDFRECSAAGSRAGGGSVSVRPFYTPGDLHNTTHLYVRARPCAERLAA